MQEEYLSPSHWSGQGAPSSWLADLKQGVPGRSGREAGAGGCLRQAGREWTHQDFLWEKRPMLILTALSCGFSRRRGLDPTWLWCRPAATALIGPLVWDPPNAAGATPPQKKR